MSKDEVLILVVVAFVLFCLLIPQIGKADYLEVSGFAWHAEAHNLGPKNKNYNETNLGLGYEHILSNDSSLSLGYYENSFFRNSNYLLYMYQPYHYGGWKFGASFGGLTGYVDKVTPIVMPTISYEWHGVGFNLFAIPAPPINKKSVLGLQFKIRID